MSETTHIQVSFGLMPDGAHRARRLLALAAVVVSIVALTGLAADDSRTFPAGILLVFISALTILLVQGLLAMRTVQPRMICAIRTSGQLTMGPPAVASLVLHFGLALSLMSGFLILLDTEALALMDSFQRRYFLAVPLAGTWLFTHELWNLRRPAGLTLTEDHIGGVRYGPKLASRWDQVTKVSVSAGKSGGHLILETDGGPKVVRHGAVGGDLHAVATIVDY